MTSRSGICDECGHKRDDLKPGENGWSQWRFCGKCWSSWDQGEYKEFDGTEIKDIVAHMDHKAQSTVEKPKAEIEAAREHQFSSQKAESKKTDVPNNTSTDAKAPQKSLVPPALKSEDAKPSQSNASVRTEMEADMPLRVQRHASEPQLQNKAEPSQAKPTAEASKVQELVANDARPHQRIDAHSRSKEVNSSKRVPCRPAAQQPRKFQSHISPSESKCKTPGCPFLRHRTQRHPFCCMLCRDGRGHGPSCEFREPENHSQDLELDAERIRRVTKGQSVLAQDQYWGGKWHRARVMQSRKPGTFEIEFEWDTIPSVSFKKLNQLRDVYGRPLSGPLLDDGRPVVQIACLGDSMTFGGYPVFLRDELHGMVVKGSLPRCNIKVRDFGCNSCTAMQHKDDSYANSQPFREALQVRSEIDLAVFMLGTNDSKTYIWNQQRYEDEFAALIQQVQGKDSQHLHPKVLLVAPPPLESDGQWEMQRSIVNDGLPKIISRLATRLQVEYANACHHMKVLRRHPNPFYEHDGVHLTGRGDQELARILGREVARVLKSLAKLSATDVEEAIVDPQVSH